MAGPIFKRPGSLWQNYQAEGVSFIAGCSIAIEWLRIGLGEGTGQPATRAQFWHGGAMVGPRRSSGNTLECVKLKTEATEVKRRSIRAHLGTYQESGMA